MNAVDPPRKLRALSSESRVLRRGVLGDRVDGRSREGGFLTKIERELTRQAGGAPSFAQTLLIRRLARAALRLELIDERSLSGTLSDHANVRPILDSLGDVSASAKAKALNERNVPTPRGGKWTARSVLNVLARAV